MFLSETLPVVVIETLEKVDNSESSVFSELIEIAGLDPSVDLIGANFSNFDFRGSNLSGYNFSKCEMLNCIKDETTVISPQTVFPPEATFLTERQIQVHERMLAIQSTEGTQRKRLVKQLIEEVGETRHTRAFLISQAKKATSWSELFDYLDFLTDFPTEADELKVKDKLYELIQKSFRQRRSQSSSKRGGQIRLSNIIARMEISANPLAENILEVYQEAAGSDMERIDTAFGNYQSHSS